MSLSSSKQFRHFSLAIFLAGWVIVGFFVAQMSIVFLWQVLQQLPYFQRPLEDSPVLQLSLSALAYVAALTFVVGVPWLVLPRKKRALSKLVGVVPGPRFYDAGVALIGYGCYLFMTIAVAVGVQLLWKEFPFDQTQQVGFGNLSDTTGYVMAFIALVIIPPIAEELLFRGYFFGQVRKNNSFVASAIITSVLFGLVHWQWNVGIDVFVLSLVLCYLRETTGAIWAGIVVHMIKNAVAFAVLFFHAEITTFLTELYLRFIS